MDREVFFEKLHKYPKVKLVNYLWAHDYDTYYGKSLIYSNSPFATVNIINGNHELIKGKYIVFDQDKNGFSSYENMADTISNLDVKTFFSDFESEDYAGVLEELGEHND